MTWKNCRNILCVRPDNMGDLLMTTPAIAALKETFDCTITLLTSSMAMPIVPYIPCVDHTIVWDAPWVKSTKAPRVNEFEKLIADLKRHQFDGAILFTVFSQNPLPTALILTLAGIPNRLAYCRENPYHLLSHWIPEKEPYTFIRHQTRRDLDLVNAIGASTSNERINVRLPTIGEQSLRAKLEHAGIDATRPWLILHPGVSEIKRQYPADKWITVGRQIVDRLDYQVIVTGVDSERRLAESICDGIGKGAHSLAGRLSIEAFITLIRLSPLLISVNTASVHIAAAVHTKVIVLYALTNPQHAPWKSIGKVLPFSIREELQSRNEVLQFVNRRYFGGNTMEVTPEQVLSAVEALLIRQSDPPIDTLVAVPPASSGNQEHFVFP